MTQRVPLPMDEPASAPPPAQLVGHGDPQVAVLTDPLTPEQMQALREQIVGVLHTCFDPEIPVNIYELGLIYDIAIVPTGAVAVRMTLTSPACPVAGSLPPDVQRKIAAVPQVTEARVDVVWDPPWDKSRMSEAAKLQLGIDD